MTNRKTVMSYLEGLAQDDWQKWHSDSEVQEIAKAALELLKEQEPKPIAYTDNPYTGLPVARCPKCGKFARQFHAFTDEETHYCPWCGQEMKWDD